MFDTHGEGLAAGISPITPEEFRARQQRVADLCGADSLLLIPNNPVAMRSGDVEYPFRSASNMLYFTGWTGPSSLCCIALQGGIAHTTMFVPPRDKEKEIWTGIRIGIDGAEENYPIDEAYSLDDLPMRLPLMLNEFKTVFHTRGIDIRVDEIVDEALLEVSRTRQKSGVGPDNLCDPRHLISEMRLIKSEAEIELMRASAQLATTAHLESMRRAEAGMMEYQLQGIIEGCFTIHGSQWSYPSIVGGGDNATILHYNENDSPINDGEMVLIDAGCEVSGYASDITRTWPINGKFGETQKLIYELVLGAQKAALDLCRPGEFYTAPHNAVREHLAKGLLELGIIPGPTLEDALREEQLGMYYMHNTSHWLGLDVHDVGIYSPNGEPRQLEEGMVLTVEPGLYFGKWREDLEIDEKWLGIGVRIEDDVLITESGCEILTRGCPKTVAELESIIGTASS